MSAPSRNPRKMRERRTITSHAVSSVAAPRTTPNTTPGLTSLPNSLYEDSVASIVERDFFPNLPRLRLERTIMELQDKRDELRNSNTNSPDLNSVEDAIQRARADLEFLLEYERTARHTREYNRRKKLRRKEKNILVSVDMKELALHTDNSKRPPDEEEASVIINPPALGQIRSNDRRPLSTSSTICEDDAGDNKPRPRKTRQRERLVALLESSRLHLDEFQSRYYPKRVDEVPGKTDVLGSSTNERTLMRINSNDGLRNGMFGPIRKPGGTARSTLRKSAQLNYTATRLTGNDADVERNILSAVDSSESNLTETIWHPNSSQHSTTKNVVGHDVRSAVDAMNVVLDSFNDIDEKDIQSSINMVRK